MFNIIDLQKNAEAQCFEETLDLKETLQSRNREVLDLSPVSVSGHIQYEDGLFILSYDLSYQITLASSRSMQPVLVSENYLVNEIFMLEADFQAQKHLIDEDMVLIIEGDGIDLAESVADNVLLHIPMKVLTPEEEKGTVLPSGKNWQVMTEDDYAAQQKANSPFASLEGLFDKDED